MKLDQLKRVNLVELLTRTWGMTFTREGSGFKALSPFNAENDPSFYAAMAEDGHWVYCDHSDGSSGSIIDLVMRRYGLRDFRSAFAAALKMVGESGLQSAPPSFEEETDRSDRDWEWLYARLRKNDPAPCLDYLTGRGLDRQLVERLIADGTVVLNPTDASRYCCFAVRDGSGRLRSLFNRLIDGPAEREKFLLGRQHPFCPDFGKLSAASEVVVCESIIDALSVLTLQPSACVVAVPGANFDLSRLKLPAAARIVEAFDADAAGRSAAARLARLRPAGTVRAFDLHGCGDVNQYLMQTLSDNARPRTLSVEDRLAISLDSRPSRTVAAEYGVHHSYVCKLRAEAADLLRTHWQNKRLGRKPAPPPAPDAAELEARLELQTQRADFLSMRSDWLALELKFHEDRDAELERGAVPRKRKKKAPKKKKKSSR